MVLTFFCYSVMLGGNSDFHRVCLVPNRIIRLIFDLKHVERCRPVFRKKRILSLTRIFIMKCAVFAFTNHEIFNVTKEFRNYNTRLGDKFTFSLQCYSKYEKSPYYSCTKVYNSTTEYIRTSSKLHIFRNKFKRFLSIS